LRRSWRGHPTKWPGREVTVLGGVVEERAEELVVGSGEEVCVFAAVPGCDKPLDLFCDGGGIVADRSVAELERGGGVEDDRVQRRRSRTRSGAVDE
jgi:hypothetical protein